VNRAYTLSHKNYSILQEAAPVIKSLQEYITNEYNSAEGVCPAAQFIPGDNFHSIESVESDSYCNILVTTKANSLLPAYYVKLQPRCENDSIEADINSWLALSNVDGFAAYGAVPRELARSRAFSKFTRPLSQTRYSYDAINSNHYNYTDCKGFS
jgi:hypothetical protein